MSKRTPNGYWRAWDHVEQALRPVIKKLGHFPSQNELAQEGLTKIAAGIFKYHSGMRAAQDRMGYKTKRREDGHWTLENTLAECRKLMGAEGHLPAQNWLRAHELSYLASAIDQHGGMHAIRNVLGDEAPEAPKGYWTRKQAYAKYQELTDKLGAAPSINKLNELKLGGLTDAINKKYGGLRAVRKALGLSQPRLDNGYWTPERTIKACKHIVAEEGRIPQQSWLQKHAPSGLSTAIGKHGGLQKMRQRLGVYEETNKPDGYWNKTNTLKEAKALVAELGYLPAGSQLAEMNKSSLNGAIVKHYGFARMRQLLGVDVVQRETGYWTEQNVLTECKKFVQEHQDLFPANKMNEMGCGDLCAQIQRHGGFTHFRELLGLETMRPSGYWNEENTFAEAKSLYDRLGYLPTCKELIEQGLSSLNAAIGRNFGIKTLRRMLNGEPNQKEQLEGLLKKYADGNKSREI